MGETYILPEIETTGQNVVNDSLHEIVRKNPDLLYADSVYSKELEGAIIYLISGHGGPDPGAVAEVEGNTLCEDVITSYSIHYTKLYENACQVHPK